MSALVAAILALLHPHPAVVPTTAPPPPTTAAPPPVTQPKAIPSPARALGAVWACIRAHESGDNYATNTGNGYTGAYQMLPHTWDVAVAGAGWPQYANGRADLAPPASPRLRRRLAASPLRLGTMEHGRWVRRPVMYLLLIPLTVALVGLVHSIFRLADSLIDPPGPGPTSEPEPPPLDFDAIALFLTLHDLTQRSLL